MTKKCDKCGMEMLKGRVYDAEMRILSDTLIVLDGGVCWNCGHVMVSASLEKLHENMFRTAAESMLTRRELVTIPLTFEKALHEIAETSGIPLEFLEKHVDAFLEYLNDPEKLFERLIRDENVGRRSAEELFGLVFRYEDDRIVVEDRRMINEL